MSLVFKGWISELDGSQGNVFTFGIPNPDPALVSTSQRGYNDRNFSSLADFGNFVREHTSNPAGTYNGIDQRTTIFFANDLTNMTNVRDAGFVPSCVNIPVNSGKIIWFENPTVTNARNIRITCYQSGSYFLKFEFRRGDLVSGEINPAFSSNAWIPWVTGAYGYIPSWGGCGYNNGTLYIGFWNNYGDIRRINKPAWWDIWADGLTPINPDDPYNGGKYNKGKRGGGDEGKWVNPQPPTPVPSLPWQQILNAGLLNCYEVSHADLQNIADFLFDPDIFNELMKIGTDLYDYICGLYMVPVTLQTGGVEKLALGNVYTNPAIQKYVNLDKVTEQYYEIDCGSVVAEEYWGNALDYNPYTRVTIMLPYIGAKEISADEVMGKNLHLVYHVDILSGACVAFLYEILSEGGQAVIYQFSGNCLMQLPLNSTDHNNLLAGVAQTVIAGAAAAYTAGAGAAAVAAVGTASQTASAHITAEKQFLSTEASVTTGIASNTVGNKVNVERSGSISGALGFLGIQTPYLLIQRPTQAYPENFGHYKGYPCNQELKLGDLEGYTVVDSIILNGLVGTEPEIAEIYDLLSKGVII